jgi:hypothetical protein
VSPDDTGQGAAGPRWGLPLVVALVALPALLAVATLVGRHWYAASDQALIGLRIDDTGGSHTPLVGVGSRLGWSHPGPWSFWVLAPFRRLFGSTGVLAGVGVVNLLAAVGVVVVAHRRGGLRLAALFGIAVALLVNALGTGALVDPWNPTFAFLPFLLYVVLVWAVVSDDLPMLPWAVAVGSWSVQSHFGYLPLVGGLLAFMVVWVVVAGRRAPDRPTARWLTIAAVTGLVVWLPPIIEQLTTPRGNLELLYQFATDPGEAPRGWDDGFGVMGIELEPFGAWITGDDIRPSGVARTGPVWPAFVTVAAVVAATIGANRRGEAAVARLGVVALVAAALAVVATARITGLFAPYIFRWWWAVAAAATVVVIHAVLSMLEQAAPRAGWVLVAAPIAGLAAVTGLLVASMPVHLPFEEVSDGLAAVAGPVTDALEPDGEYLVRGVDSATFGASIHGLFLELERRGVDVRSDRLEGAERAYGEWRLADPDEVDGILTIITQADLEDGVEPPRDGRVVARHERPEDGGGDGYVVYLSAT